MKNKTLYVPFISLIIFLVSAMPVSAQHVRVNVHQQVQAAKQNRIEVREEIREGIQENQQNRIEKREEIRNEFKEKINEIKDTIKEKIGLLTHVIKGTITGINGTMLTVDKDGTSYTVNTGEFEKCTTKFRRRFWGTGNLDEFSVGDSVNVWGRFTDETKTTINACMIRDLSIQMRHGVFIGEVLSVSENGFVMSTKSTNREDQTVTVSGNTAFIDRTGETISQSDILVGHRVRVRGLWNRNTSTITDVREVKDFSIPEKSITTE